MTGRGTPGHSQTGGQTIMRTVPTLVVLATLAIVAPAGPTASVLLAAPPAPSEQARAAEARERERAAEQRERELERAAEQRERERQRAEEARERARQARERAAEQRRNQNRATQTELVTRTLRLGDAGDLELANIAGDIIVTRREGQEAAVEILKTARARTEEEARELLRAVQVDIVERGTRAEIRTRYPQGEGGRRSWRGGSVTVDLKVAAPAGTRVHARSISGSISATDIRGELALESVSGTVKIANAGRIAAAKSISGSVEIAGASSEGAIEASTASGGVVIRQVKARAIEASSISGNLLLENVDAQRIEAQTVSGDLRIGGALARNGRYELTSHSGSVQAAIAGGPGFEVEATSFSGAVRSDFPLKTRGDQGGPGHRIRALRGTYGDGSAVLELTTFSGSITISKK